MASNWDPEYVYKDNQYYKNYEVEKEEIKSKYPSEIFDNMSVSGQGKHQEMMYEEYISTNQRELHKQYLKEIADLIFQPNGQFQEFTWDTMSEVSKDEMKRKARGRLNRGITEY